MHWHAGPAELQKLWITLRRVALCYGRSKRLLAASLDTKRTITNGARPMTTQAMQAPGTKVLVSQPYIDMLQGLCDFCGCGKCRFVSFDTSARAWLSLRLLPYAVIRYGCWLAGTYQCTSGLRRLTGVVYAGPAECARARWHTPGNC